MELKFNIPDKRSTRPEDYKRLDRRGQMKRSWSIGAKRRQDNREMVSFDDGLTWGSIGQILGYLFGQVDAAFQNELFDKMLAAYTGTDRGKLLRNLGVLAGEATGVMMRFATWNLRYSGKAHSLMRLNFLKSMEWDVIALQEVSRTAWKVFMKENLAASGFYTLEGFGLTPKGKRPYGVALLARNGFTLAEPELIPGLPIAERGLAAKVQGPVTPITVASWHAPNTAGAGAEIKMQGYRGIIDWLGNVAGPLILGFDGNHWNRSTSLELEVVTDSNNPWYLEKRFFGANPPHRLRDALIGYYKKDAEAYRAVKESRSDDEPLAVSYVRGSKKWPVEDRFDYVFVSDEIEVLHCYYNYEGARVARSDHGIVVADLRIGL